MHLKNGYFVAFNFTSSNFDYIRMAFCTFSIKYYAGLFALCGYINLLVRFTTFCVVLKLKIITSAYLTTAKSSVLLSSNMQLCY